MKKKVLIFTNQFEDFVKSRFEFMNFLISHDIACDVFHPKHIDQIKKNSFNLFTYSYFRNYFMIFNIPNVILKLRGLSKNNYNIIYSIKIFPNLVTGLYKFLFNKNQKIIALIAGRGLFQNIDKNFVIYLIFKFYVKVLKQFDEIIVQNYRDKLFFEKYLKRDVILVNGSGYKINPNINEIIESSAIKNFKCINNNTIIFSFPTRIVKSKGIIELIEAFNDPTINSNATLLISGWLDQKSLKQYFKKHINNKNIFFVGNNDIEQIMNISDCIILPSTYGEGVPRVLIEGLAHSKPIITSSTQGCEDTFDNNGFKLTEVSKLSIVNAVNNFCLLTDFELSNMKANSLSLFNKKFHSDIIFNDTLEIINSIK
jgi:glycosyltransferase involved in cell wall biosynthesis